MIYHKGLIKLYIWSLLLAPNMFNFCYSMPQSDSLQSKQILRNQVERIFTFLGKDKVVITDTFMTILKNGVRYSDLIKNIKKYSKKLVGKKPKLSKHKMAYFDLWFKELELDCMGSTDLKKIINTALDSLDAKGYLDQLFKTKELSSLKMWMDDFMIFLKENHNYKDLMINVLGSTVDKASLTNGLKNAAYDWLGCRQKQEETSRRVVKERDRIECLRVALGGHMEWLKNAKTGKEEDEISKIIERLKKGIQEHEENIKRLEVDLKKINY